MVSTLFRTSLLGIPFARLLLFSSILAIAVGANAQRMDSTCIDGHLVTYLQKGSRNHLVVMETERPTTATASDVKDQSTPAGWVRFTDGQASNGGYVVVPTDLQNADDAFDGARLNFEIEFVQTGIHYVYLRHRSSDGEDNSVHLLIDGIPFYTDWHLTENSNEWRWEQAPVGFEVTSMGKHTISISLREDGTPIDKVIVSTRPNKSFAGFGPEPTEKTISTARIPVDQANTFQQIDQEGRVLTVIEAERPTANVFGAKTFNCFSWLPTKDNTASGGEYVIFPNEHGNISKDPTKRPRLDYVMSFSIPGTYYVHVRHNSPSGSDDSVFFGFDGNTNISTWHLYNKGDSWSWDGHRDRTFEITTPGEHVLNMYLREGGTPVDKIIITNDPDYVPTGEGPLLTNVDAPLAQYTQDNSPDHLIALVAERPTYNYAGQQEFSRSKWSRVADPTALGKAYAVMPSQGPPSPPIDDPTQAPYMEYEIEFTQTGTHYIYWRHRASDKNSDSAYWGIDGTYVAETNLQPEDLTEWSIYNDPVPFEITTTGKHTFMMAMREDNTPLDMVYISTNPALNAAALPLELIAFTGRTTDDTNALKWTTAREENVSHFTVERSEEGKAWQSVGKVTAVGSTSTNVQYDFTDHNPPQRAYYRLRCVDADGTFSVSELIVLNHTDDRSIARLSLYPNPANEQATLEYLTDLEEQLTLTVTSSTGRVISSRRYSLSPGRTSLPIDLRQFAPGVYIIHIDTNHDSPITKQLIVRP